MGQVRKTIQREVMDKLDSSFFTSEDFDVSFENKENNVLVSICFKYDKNYFLNIEKMDERFFTRQAPGLIEQEERIEHVNFVNVLNKIVAWCSEIRKELKASKPIYKEVE